MKRTASVVVFGFALVGTAYSTSVPPLSLQERVKGASHIFVGIARSLEVLDPHGNVMADPPARIMLEPSLRLTVEVKRVLRTSLKRFPRKVQVHYGRGFILGVKTERERRIGKELIYLVSGTGTNASFHSVHALQFTEPMEREKVIQGHLDKLPSE